AIPDTKEAETPHLSCALSVTVPAPAHEQASDTSSSPSAYGDSQQESTKRKLFITGLCCSDCIDPGYYKKDTESRQVSDLGGNPCSKTIDAPERILLEDTNAWVHQKGNESSDCDCILLFNRLKLQNEAHQAPSTTDQATRLSSGGVRCVAALSASSTCEEAEGRPIDGQLLLVF
ncbi:hypothetical protein V6Z90_003513, partial [Aspergillus fumigatus]